MHHRRVTYSWGKCRHLSLIQQDILLPFADHGKCL